LCYSSLYIDGGIPYDCLETFLYGYVLPHWRSGETHKEKFMAAAKMTQSQMVKELATATGTTTKAAKEFVTLFADMAVRETKKNGMFVIPGIGRLVRVDRKARMGRNPATGEAIKIPAKKVVKFRVAKAVKDAIVPKKK
jgi:DNA-binding protein HU-beta